MATFLDEISVPLARDFARNADAKWDYVRPPQGGQHCRCCTHGAFGIMAGISCIGDAADI
jgi:hypothetical protein